METLDDFKDATDKEIEKKDKLVQKAETLDSHIQKIQEQRDNEILKMLNRLKGDASAKVKTALDMKVHKKFDLLNETNAEIDSRNKIPVNVGDGACESVSNDRLQHKVDEFAPFSNIIPDYGS